MNTPPLHKALEKARARKQAALSRFNYAMTDVEHQAACYDLLTAEFTERAIWRRLKGEPA